VKILVADDAQRPQLAVTSMGPDLIPAYDRYMLVYTGAVHVGHYAGQDPSNLDVQFPLVYISSPGDSITIRGFADPTVAGPSEFLAAVVHTSISGFVDKTDPAIVHILSSRADLCEVHLHPPHGGPHPVLWTVVLSATVKAQNAEFHHVGYQVTVLKRSPRRKGSVDQEIQVDGTWDGTYDSIGRPPIQGIGAPGHG
jgi:hypothetical protein